MSEKFVLHALAAEVAAGQGAAVEVGSWRNLTATVRVTAGSGTVNPFRVWLEGSPDGTNWYELPCTTVLKAGAAAPGAAATDERDIVNETAVVTSASYVGKCELYVSQVRAAWNIAGTTPSETFEVLASGK